MVEGGKLLGGSYLILFVLGMIFQKYSVLDQRSRWINISLILLCGAFLLTFAREECRTGYAFAAKLPFGGSINPPNISQMLIALTLLVLCAACYNLAADIKVPLFFPVCSVMEYLGKHSLYIFLYHWFFVTSINAFLLNIGLVVSNTWMSNVLNVCLGILMPLLWEHILKYLKKVFLQPMHTH